MLKEQVAILEGRVQQLQSELAMAQELLRSMKIQVNQREREVARTMARKAREKSITPQESSLAVAVKLP